MRHPIYAGLLAICVGLSLLTNFIDRLVWTAVLYAVLDRKSDMEEAALEQRFPNDYPEYQYAVPNKFVPVALLELRWWKNV